MSWRPFGKWWRSKATTIRSETQGRYLTMATMRFSDDGHIDPQAVWSGQVLRNDGSATSLSALLDERRDLALVDGGDGPHRIPFHFSHVLIALPAPAAAFAIHTPWLEEQIERRFGKLIDPEAGVRVATADGGSLDDMMVAFGAGVFVPVGGSLPQGRLTFAPDEGEPRAIWLPDGRDAGFYPGQRGLCFASNIKTAFATHPDLPQGVRFYIGREPEDEAIEDFRSSLQPRRWLVDAAGGDVLIGHADRGQADAAWRIEDSRGGRSGRLELSLDRRTSRLRAEPPPGLSLRVLGIGIGDGDGSGRIRRWWINRTRMDGRFVLRASALQRRSDTILNHGGRLDQYDWRSMRYRTEVLPGLSATIESIGGIKRHIVRCSEADGFGYIAVPSGLERVSFAPDSGAPGVVLLDWLDQAVGIEESGSRAKIAFSKRYGDLDAGEIGSDGSSVVFRPRRAMSRVGPDGGTGTAFSLVPGEQAWVGPLLVQAALRGTA